MKHQETDFIHKLALDPKHQGQPFGLSTIKLIGWIQAGAGNMISVTKCLISLAPVEADFLLHCVYQAMYAAKQTRFDRYQCFDGKSSQS